MATILEVPFDGGTILFEAPESEGARAFAAGDVLEKAQDTLDQAVDTVVNVATAFSGRLAQLSFDSAEVTLGIKISGKGKFIVAEAAAEASLSVKIAFKAAKG